MPDITIDPDKQPMSQLIYDALLRSYPAIQQNQDPAVQQLYGLFGHVMSAVIALEAQINMGFPRPEYETDADLAGSAGERAIPRREIPEERFGPLHVRLLEVERRLDELG